jgi:hypothetical protein
MIRHGSRDELWMEVCFAGLLSSIAFGSSFEGLANFLIAGVSGASDRSGAEGRCDAEAISDRLG